MCTVGAYANGNVWCIDYIHVNILLVLLQDVAVGDTWRQVDEMSWYYFTTARTYNYLNTETLKMDTPS